MRKLLASACLSLCVTGCFGQKKDVSEYLERARRDLAAGNKVDAKTELKNALGINPIDPRTNLALAKIEDGEGNLQAAIPHYVLAAVPDARLSEAQLRLVAILLDANRLQDANGLLTATLGSFPGNTDALALRADLAERQNQPANARTDAETVLKAEPGNARVSAVLALVALRARDTTRAMNVLDAALAKHPDDVRLLQIQATTLLMANQPDRAIVALRSITRSTPRNALVQSALANAQAGNGQAEEAMAGFQAAVATDPTNQEMQLAFVKFLEAMKPAPDVVSYLKKLVADFPRSGTYDLVLAGYYHDKGKLAESQQVLESGAARLGSEADAVPLEVALARIEAERGQNAAAVARLGHILTANPGNENALFSRAQLNLDAGRVPAAIDDLIALVRINPLNGPAFQKLALAYMAQKDTKLAIDAMRRAAATQPGDETAQVQLAVFLEGAGDASGARDILTRLTSNSPGVPAIWVADGQVAIARKDWAEAARAVSRLKLLPTAAPLAFALEGQLNAARGDDASALKAFLSTSSGDFDPALFGAIVRAAVAAGQAGTVAQQLTDRVAQLPPTVQKNCWLAIALLQLQAEHPSDADAAFKHVTSLAPADASAYSIYVGLLVERKMFDRAKDVLSAGLASEAPKSPMLLLQGWVLESAGDLIAAQASYRDALTADPLSVQAANNYANLLADREPKNVAALTEIRDRLNGAENVSDPSIVDTIAWLDYRLNRLDEAKTLLMKIKAAESTNPQIRFHLAAVLLASGDRKGGLALLDTVKGLTFPGSDEVRRLSET